MTLVLTGTDETDLHERSGIERRRGLRIRQARPIKVYEPVAGRYLGGQTQDISATGLKIELPVSSPVRPGRLLTVQVGGNLANRRQMIPARVVWIDRSNVMHSGRMTAGVEFLASIAAHRDAA